MAYITTMNRMPPTSTKSSCSASPDIRARLEFTGWLATGAHVALVITRNGQTETRLPINLSPLQALDSDTTDHWQIYRQLTGSEEQRSRMQLMEVFYEKPYSARVRDCHQSAERLVSGFNRWCAGAEMQQLVTQLRTRLSPDDRAQLLIVATDPQIEQLPWQKWTLLDDYPHIEPTFSSPQLSKCPAGDASGRERSTARILAVFGDGRNLDTTADRRALEQIVNDADRHADSGGQRAIELEFLIEPTRVELEEALHEQDWDILFFAGHSKTEADSGQIFISATEMVTIQKLWYSLQTAADRGLRLAIFNSCEGLGIAKGLNTARIPQMVIMRKAVPDLVAQKFLQYFLHGFARQGLTLAEAVRDARQRLAHLEQDHPCATWLPTLYQHPEADVLTWEQLLPARTRVEVPPRSSPEPVRSQRQSVRRVRRMQLRVMAGLIGLSLGWLLTAKLAQTVGMKAFKNEQLTLATHAFQLDAVLRPLAGEPRYNLAQIYDRRAYERNRAIELMKGAATRGFVMAYSEWARMLMDRNDEDDLEMAIAVIERGFAILATLPPETPNLDIIREGLYVQRAWWLLYNSKLDDAGRDAREVIRTYSTSAKAWCVLAKVQMAQQRKDAREAWQNVYRYADRGLKGQKNCWLEAVAYLDEHSLKSSPENSIEKNTRNP